MQAAATNKNVNPNVRIEVRHAGKNDYRVELSGIGEYSQHQQFGEAFSKMNWLASLDQEALNWEIAKVQNANDAISQYYNDRNNSGLAALAK